MNDWRSYDGVAETYERVHAPHLAGIGRDLVALGAPSRGARVLDVGTGTGVTAEAAAGAVGDGGVVVGVDLSLDMMRVGRAERSSSRFVGGDVIDLPFRDAAFEVVTGNFVLHHFRRYETALFDMLRVVRSGGRLALSTWGPGLDDLEKTWRSLVEEVLGPEMLRDVQRQASPWRERFEHRDAIEEALSDAGLRHIRVEGREYRFVFALNDWLEGRAALPAGRFLSQMVGPERFNEFLDRARDVYADRFSDPVNDFRDVWLGVGTKPR
jgi:ubiquinone/menaquinone biosynthesis C-methylase UbiE